MSEKTVRVLSMYHKYIAWTIRGRKKATTRLSVKPFGDYELCHRKNNGAFEHSGVVVRIYKTSKWTLAGVLEKDLKKIAHAEGFETTEELIKVLTTINAKRRDQKVMRYETPLYTHYYRVVVVPERVKHLYDWKEGGKKYRCPVCEETFASVEDTRFHSAALKHWGDFNG
jgi:hypothetical protein